jgi:outer membrane immunogenic protein
MCRTLATITALAFISTGMPAWAQDWTGYYVGVNVGAALNNGDYDLEPTGCYLDPACIGVVGAGSELSSSARLDEWIPIGGAQVGANWQTNRIVFGLEGDIDWKGFHDSDTVTRTLGPPYVGNPAFTSTVSVATGWIATIRGRAGVAPAPGVLLYATGGVALAEVKSDTSAMFAAPVGTSAAGSYSDVRVGWTVGAGGEWAFTNNWSAKLEYLFVDLGDLDYASQCVAPAINCAEGPLEFRTRVDLNQHLFRIGLNRKLGGGP